MLITSLDAAVLKTLRDDVLTADLVGDVVTRTIELARLEPDEHAMRRQSLVGEAARVAAAIENLTAAIASGGQLATLVTALKAREQVGPTSWRDSSISTGLAARPSGATASAASCAPG